MPADYEKIDALKALLDDTPDLEMIVAVIHRLKSLNRARRELLASYCTQSSNRIQDRSERLFTI